MVDAPAHGDDWIELCSGALPVAEAGAWVVRPACGAVVSFAGTARDVPLDYEAYEEHAERCMTDVARELRARWPVVGRVAILHRVGRVEVGEAWVVVAVSAPHREEAFAAARFGIDTVKATAPIWKQELQELKAATEARSR